MDHLERARHYRDEAKSHRKLAEQDDCRETREHLLSVALTYDRLFAEQMALTKTKLG